MPKRERIFPSFILLYDPTDSWPAGHSHDLLRLRRDMQTARAMGEPSWWPDGCQFREVGKADAPVLTLRGGELVDDAGRAVYQIERSIERRHNPIHEERQAQAATMHAGGARYAEIAEKLKCTVPAVGGLLQKWRSKHPEFFKQGEQA